jgi:hypothetical protein
LGDATDGMTTSLPSVGGDGSLRVVVLERRLVLSQQQVRILAILWQTAGKQLPSAGLYALVWHAPFASARSPALTQSQRTSAAMSVRRLHKAGLACQPRPLWLGLTADGGQLMYHLIHDWEEWESYQRRFLDPD